jgi:hypothetical protein
MSFGMAHFAISVLKPTMPVLLSATCAGVGQSVDEVPRNEDGGDQQAYQGVLAGMHVFL